MKKKLLLFGIIISVMCSSMTTYAVTPRWKNPIPKSYYTNLNKAKEACYNAGLNVKIDFSNIVVK